MLIKIKHPKHKQLFEDNFSNTLVVLIQQKVTPTHPCYTGDDPPPSSVTSKASPLIHCADYKIIIQFSFFLKMLFIYLLERESTSKRRGRQREKQGPTEQGAWQETPSLGPWDHDPT